MKRPVAIAPIQRTAMDPMMNIIVVVAFSSTVSLGTCFPNGDGGFGDVGFGEVGFVDVGFGVNSGCNRNIYMERAFSLFFPYVNINDY